MMPICGRGRFTPVLDGPPQHRRAFARTAGETRVNQRNDCLLGLYPDGCCSHGPEPKSAWTIVALAGGAVLLGGTLPWSGRDAGLDAAFAARAPGTQGRQVKTPKPAEADHPPVVPEGTWSDAAIIAGLEECVRLLAPTGAEVEISKPIRNGQCGTPAPILLKRIAGVEVTPPAVVNCRRCQA